MGELKNIVQFKFYKKQMADKTPIRADNALPNQMKMATAVQEVLRRLKNTSRALPQETFEEILVVVQWHS